MHPYPFIKIIPQLIPRKFSLDESGNLLVSTPSINGFFPDFPFMYLAGGIPWKLGNLYLVKYAKERTGANPYNSQTINSIARSLIDYAAFIESEGLSFIDMPTDKFERPTYLYRADLINRCKQGEIKATTAQQRMSSVINFYRGLSHWDLIDDVMFERTHTPKTVFIQIVNNEGFAKTHTVTTSDLAIRIAPTTLRPGQVQDGGVLTPLLPHEQTILWQEVKKLDRCQQLMFRVAAETGARLQTVSTLRWSSVLDAVCVGDTYFLEIGANSLVDSKFEKSYQLQMSSELREALLIFVQSPTAKDRRDRSFYGDCEKNYVFLTSQGAPYVTSRQEQIDRKGNNAYPITLADKFNYSDLGDKPAKTKRGNTLQVVVLRIKKNIWKKHPNFPDFSFHDLRATFAVNLLNLELDYMFRENARLKAQGALEAITITDCLHTVRKAMGHSSLATTEQYLQFRNDQTEPLKEQVRNKYSRSMLSPKDIAI
jgi:integrase